MHPSLSVIEYFSCLAMVALASLAWAAGAELPAENTNPAGTQAPSLLRDYLGRAHLQGRFAAYTPHFHIDEFAPGKWWILDGTLHVGVVVQDLDCAELVNFNPYHPLPNAPFPKIYHAPTQPGDRMTMAKTFLPKPEKDNFHFTVTPEQVTLHFTVSWADGRTRDKTLTWKVDPDFGYIVHCVEEMHAAEPGALEYTNFLPRGATDDRPETRRYTYILWEHPSGKIYRWNQNNMSARLPGSKDVYGLRCLKTGGFIGYFGEKDRSPALELLESTPGTHSDTCTNMLDEHITWLPGDKAQAAQDTEGKYISRAVYNLVSLPPEVATMLTQKAELIDLWLGKPQPVSYWGFTQGVPVDFENKLDPNAFHRGVIFAYPEDDANAPVTVVSDCGHSGSHSLRMRANGAPVQFLMDGGSVHVTEGKHYRLYAWIKTDLTDGKAVLKADEALFTYDNITAVHQAAPITGKTDWQEVSLDFTPGEKAHVAILYVVVSGHGTVWVDDFLLKQFTDYER